MVGDDRGALAIRSKHSKQADGNRGKSSPNKFVACSEFAIVDERLPFKAGTAEKLMAVARNPIISNSEHAQNLPPSWDTLYQLTRVPEPELRAAAASARNATGPSRGTLRESIGLRLTPVS
jgi:hypothetical protein